MGMAPVHCYFGKLGFYRAITVQIKLQSELYFVTFENFITGKLCSYHPKKKNFKPKLTISWTYVNNPIRRRAYRSINLDHLFSFSDSLATKPRNLEIKIAWCA
jgi:hypothetical protein